MLELRQYQKDALNVLYNKLKTNNKVLLALPTGAGKTFMMVEWAKKMAQQHKKTAIIVDRIELVQQTLKLLKEVQISVLHHDYTFDADALIHIIMLQTANRQLNKLLDVQFDYIFFDEIHQYCEGTTFAALCDCQNNAKIIGVSATPIDDKGYLLRGFDDCINDVQTQHLIDQGYLVKPTYYAPADYNLNLRYIRLTGGDYDTSELDQLMANVECAEKIYDAWFKIAKSRKTIVFCTSVKQAQILCKYFCEQDQNARVVHSQMNYDDRESVLYNFRIGIVNVIFNVGILVAGYDEPTVDCIVFANPTKRLRRYLQQAGRGLRTAPNKKDCIMLDCADIVREHGFCNDLRFYKPKQKPEELCAIKQCPECGAIVSKSTQICPYCSYDFRAVIEENKSMTKKQLQQLEKAFDMQLEIKRQIAQLVDERGYKNGYKWYLFIDCLKTKHATESSIQFFRRKLTKIRKIKQKNYKLAALQYD